MVWSKMQTVAERIVIIGNGFDRHHRCQSSYAHYKDWLENNNPSLLSELENYINVGGEWWNEFERNLAEFDIRKVIEECPREDFTLDPRALPPFVGVVSGFFCGLRDRIAESFVEWVKTLSVEPLNGVIDLPEASLYLSFNYTDTLERIYGIPEERILYIHGKASRGDKLVFGHNKSPFEIERDHMRKYGLKEIERFYDTANVITEEEYQLALRISFLDKSPYTQIVAFSEILTPAIKASKEIISYGLSFSEVDSQYLEWIADQNPGMTWKVGWHTEDDKAREESFFAQMGVEAYELFEF